MDFNLNANAYLIDHLNHLVSCFYVNVLESILKNEKKRIGSDAFKAYLNVNLINFFFFTFLKFNLNISLKAILKNEIFHTSLYICCFELLLNFTNIKCSEQAMYNINKKTNNENHQTPTNTKLINFLSGSSNKLQFPWSINLVQLKPYDFCRTIETFIRTTSCTSSNPKQTNLPQTKELAQLPFIISRDMVKYLNACEEKIIEYLAWKPDSPLWSQLDAVKLANPQPNESIVKTQLDMPFPLYDEVNMSPTQPSTSTTNGAQQNGVNNGSNGLLGAVVSGSANNNNNNNNSEIILNLTPNPQTTSANFASSPVKHPTITRVVGSSANTNETNSSTAAKVVLHQAKSKINRLQNVSGSLTYFLRKFYSLANARMRELVEKLDTTNDLFHQHNAKSEALISSTPAAAATTAATSIITPTTTMITNTNNQHVHLITEQQQLFYKKIWNIFEYSVSVGGASSSNLMQNRTLDQILMCAVYTACKISGVSIQFQDIIRIVSSTKFECFRFLFYS